MMSLVTLFGGLKSLFKVWLWHFYLGVVFFMLWTLFLSPEWNCRAKGVLVPFFPEQRLCFEFLRRLDELLIRFTILLFNEFTFSKTVKSVKRHYLKRNWLKVRLFPVIIVVTLQVRQFSADTAVFRLHYKVTSWQMTDNILIWHPLRSLPGCSSPAASW